MSFEFDRKSTTPIMKRIIIYRLGSLGDTIVALPMFNRIAELYPDHERIVLTNIPVSSKAAPLLAVLGNEIVHHAIAYPAGTRRPTELWDLRRQIRQKFASTLIYLMPSRGRMNILRDALFFSTCGFQEMLGVPWRRDLDQCRVSSESGEEEPECERLGRALAALGPFDLYDPKNWDLHLTSQEVQVAARALAPLQGRPYVAINMGGKAVEKDWGLANWRRLLGNLTDRLTQHGLVVVGAAEDAHRVQAIRDIWHGPVVDGCGQLAPRESAAAMRDARLFIGHDSGPLHLASAVGAPCLGLFGDYNRPKKWHPYLGRKSVIHDMRGVTAIEVEKVLVEAERLL
jgi:heptosyltransferase-3